MDNRLVLIFGCICIIILAGVASAETSVGQGTNGAGNVYPTGSIYVASTPAGASAVLDGGEDLLYTPGTFTSVAPGLHNVRFSKPGSESYSTNAEVTAGNTNKVIVTLSPVVQAGGLSVSSNPKGADFYIDNINMGITNQVIGNLASGNHNVTMSLAGYEIWSGSSNVISGQVTALTVNLVPEVNPPSGDLRVSSTPPGAAVYVNSDFRGSTPLAGSLDVSNLDPAIYMIVFKKSGYDDYSTPVTITAGTITQVNAVLTTSAQAPAGATAEIVSSPGGADVYIDNLYMGITPLTFQNVKAGTYTVDIELVGYSPYTASGQVAPGQDIRLNVALTPAPIPTAKTPASVLVIVIALVLVSLAWSRFCRK